MKTVYIEERMPAMETEFLKEERLFNILLLRLHYLSALVTNVTVSFKQIFSFE